MQADPFGLSRLFTIADAQGIGADRPKKSLNLGDGQGNQHQKP